MKISVVGAGNAGCFTALHYAWWTRKSTIEVELIHDPSVSPEPVGQGTILDPPSLLWAATGFDWFTNKVHATPKTGVGYEGGGKINDIVPNPFPADKLGMHFCPSEMQRSILDSGCFKVSEDDIDPKDVDADYVFDCRGKPKDLSDYDELINPINAVILGKPNWDVTCLWTRAVATPDGWAFVIPALKDSPAYNGCVGYLYNSDITSKEDAEKNFLDLFDVDISGYLKFNNYIAKNPVVDDRIFLNGNRLFFLEPLEASALQTYLEWARYSYNAIINRKIDNKEATSQIKNYIERVQNFVLWHYQFGSKYDTPFWDYAQTLSFKDPDFNIRLKQMRKLERGDIVPPLYGGELLPNPRYAYWDLIAFKMWDDGMTRQSINEVL